MSTLAITLAALAPLAASFPLAAWYAARSHGRKPNAPHTATVRRERGDEHRSDNL